MDTFINLQMKCNHNKKNSVSCNEQENVQIVEAEEVSLPEDVMPSSSRVIEDYETDRMGRTFLSEELTDAQEVDTLERVSPQTKKTHAFQENISEFKVQDVEQNIVPEKEFQISLTSTSDTNDQQRFKEEGEEHGYFTPGIVARPHSRNKRICSKKLRHPFRRLREEIPASRLHASAVCTRRKENVTTKHEPANRINTQGTRSTEGESGRCKPVSRSKRKCRFGPRHRLRQRANLGFDSFTVNVSQVKHVDLT